MSETNIMENHETMEFQAEVKQLLDIVINSLYTEREIFIRELISNAADALEKFRYECLIDQEDANRNNLPLEINIELDDKEHTLTITDNGIGMTKDELVQNLGTIAHSGSKDFIKQLTGTDKKDLNLIGQFGVGFYSAFMVAKKVRVLTCSYHHETEGYEWISDGIGSYSISPAEGLRRGTKIILALKEDAHAFAMAENIMRIIKQYSNFVPFPIKVNEEQVNTVQAIWTKNKNEITEEEYTEFYKFIANSHDEPVYRLHFFVDAPMAINALLFIPKHNFERFGYSRMEPGVNLYCRKILIQQHAEGIMPEWMRFVKGVVDSEDIPLNISRETMQDSALVAKLRKVITGRFLKFLSEQAKNDSYKFAEFWKLFGYFIKEGALSDYTHREQLAKLLRFESSKSEHGKLISITDYVDRMKDDQKDIYFMNGATRETIEAGPYLEAFRANDIEVIYTHEPIDDLVLSSLMDFEGKNIVSAEQAGLELPALKDEDAVEPIDNEELESLTTWLKEILGERISEVRASRRLVDSPAIILNLDGNTITMQRVMQTLNKDIPQINKKVLEINPRHKLVKRLSSLREKDLDFAKIVAEQILDNALISAGHIIETRSMVDRVYRILEHTLELD